MARLSFEQIVNRVLIRLREEEVASVAASDYSKLIGRLVNQAKSDVEDSWNWPEIRTELSIATVASTNTYSLTNFGERYRIKEFYNDTGNRRIFPADDERFDRLKTLQTDPTGTPQYWRVITTDANGDPQVEFWPTPNAVETIKVFAFIPQGDFAVDGSDDDTKISVPSLPVILKATALAIAERGEHGGNTYNEAQWDYGQAMNAAISQANQNLARGWSNDWVVE